MGCDWGMELVLQLGRIFHKIRVKFSCKFLCFVFLFMLVLFSKLVVFLYFF